jgi:hypothetical protein
MKYGLLTLLILWTIYPSLGQDIEKIVLISQAADEPPTKPGPAEYIMTFEINSDQEFIATHIKRNNKRRNLSEVGKIEKQRIDRIAEWYAVKKVNFTAFNLGIDRKTIGSAAENSNHKLNFKLPDEIVLDVDSFQFCQNYKMTKSVSTGGEAISVMMLAKSQPTVQFTFNSNDIGTGEFKLKDYIFCYSILNDRIPDEFPHFNFFSKTKLAQIVVYYQKTVECEGYYYQDYADKNQLTGRERRMKLGWNFVEYMKQRVKQ